MIPERPANFAFSRIRKSGAKTHSLLGEIWNTENSTQPRGLSILSPINLSKAIKILQILLQEITRQTTKSTKWNWERRNNFYYQWSAQRKRTTTINRSQESTAQSLLLQWSHLRISSTDSKVNNTFQIPSSLRASPLIGFSWGASGARGESRERIRAVAPPQLSRGSLRPPFAPQQSLTWEQIESLFVG